MSNVMKYKGYTAKIQYSDEDQYFWGEILGIRDSLSFEGENVKELNAEFRETIEYYLDECKRLGDEPNIPEEEIVLSEEVKNFANTEAQKQKITPGEWIGRVVSTYLEKPVLLTENA